LGYQYVAHDHTPNEVANFLFELICVMTKKKPSRKKVYYVIIKEKAFKKKSILCDHKLWHLDKVRLKIFDAVSESIMLRSFNYLNFFLDFFVSKILIHNQSSRKMYFPYN